MYGKTMLDEAWTSMFDEGLFPEPRDFTPHTAVAVGRGVHAAWVPSPAAGLWCELARRDTPPEEVTVMGDDLLLRFDGYDMLTRLWECLLEAGANPPRITGSIGEEGATVVASADECGVLARHLARG